VVTLENFKAALKDELDAITNKQATKKPIHIINGLQMLSMPEGSIYSFSLAEVKNIPSSYAKITIGKASYSGFVLYCEEKNLELSIDNCFEQKIDSAELVIDSSYLTQKLLERFSDVMETDNPITQLLKDLHEGRPIDLPAFQIGSEQAVDHALKDNYLSVIWGPPGTGKTQTLAKIAMELAGEGNRVLIISTSNISVDTAILRIGKLFEEQETRGRVIRYGCVFDKRLREHEFLSSGSFAMNSSSELKERFVKIGEEIREGTNDQKRYNELTRERKTIIEQLRLIERKAVSEAEVVATTVAKSFTDSLIADAEWDYVLFDEVSMALVPNTFVAASLANKKIVLIGDFEQLPSISETESKFLEMDIFEYLHIFEDGLVHKNPYMVMLNVQRRMHSKISCFVRDKIYQGLLEDDPNTDRLLDEKVSLLPFPGNPVTLVDYSGLKTFTSIAHSSRINVTSALITAKLAIEASKPEIIVGVITPYAPQAEFINSIIPSMPHDGRIICSTVHQFQGNEADVIIFDAVESRIEDKTAGLMFSSKNARRLVNVAVTRARAKLIVVADWRFLESSSQLIKDSLILDLIEYASHESSVSQPNMVKAYFSADQSSAARFFGGTGDAKNLFLNDFSQAKKIEYWHSTNNDIEGDQTFSLYDFKNEAQRYSSENGRKIRFFGKETKKLDVFSGTMRFTQPNGRVWNDFILIDDNKLWFGMPRFVNGSGSMSFILRIESEDAVHELNSLLELDDRRFFRNPNAKAKIYLQEKQKCSHCFKTGYLKVEFSEKKGSYYLMCSNCKRPNYLDDDLLTEFVGKTKGKCVCGGNLLVSHDKYTGRRFIRCEKKWVLKEKKHTELDFEKLFEQ